MHRVLLVDDARLLAELEGTALGRRSLARRVVSRDADLLAESLALRPDLIVLEEGEFCPDALDATRQLAAHPVTCSIPILYVGSPLHRDRVAELGVRAFVSRPVSRRGLREALSSSGLLHDRASVRRHVELPAQFFPDEGDAQPCRCLDLSLGGAFLDLVPSLDPGSRGRLVIDAAPRRIDLRATVVRCAGGYGIQFEPLALAEAVFFSRFVRRAGERRQVMQSEAAAAREDWK